MPEIPTRCLAFDSDLSALIDRELDAQREAEVRAHADACERCTQRLEEFCNVDLVLAGLSAPPVADDLEARFRARLAEAGPAPARREHGAPPRSRRRGMALGIAGGIAVAAAVTLALLLGLPRDVSEPGAPIAREDAPVTPEPEPTLVAELPEVAPVVVAETRAAEPAPVAVVEEPMPQPAVIEAAVAPQLVALDELPDEDVALLLDLDVVADLDLMENLDLLEALVDLGLADGA
jgi:anti-sigma factor RsiW